MSRSFLHDKRGVSEIIASLMMVLIVSVAGVALYSYSLSAFSSSGSSFQLQTDQREERARERFSMIAVWRDGDQLNLTVLNYGKIDLAIDAVYINGSSVFFSESGGRGKIIATREWCSLNFTYSTLTGGIYEIVVVSERGSKDVVYWKA